MSSIYSVLCDFSFLSNLSFFCINGFYLSDRVHKQFIFFFFISQQFPRFLPTGNRFINRPWIKYIVGVEKILGIAGFKSIPGVYYSLIDHDFHDHKRYFQCVFLSGFENESRNQLVVWPDKIYSEAHLQQGSSTPQTIADIDRS